MSWLGLDIGGANLKAATAEGWASSVPFALWRDPDAVEQALGELISQAPTRERLAVTMTGELCDCFRTKAEGVGRILAAVCEVARQREVAVYLCNGQLVSVSEAIEQPWMAAASNWRAIAELACRCVDERDGVLIDIGSTTADVIPIRSGRVAAKGYTDTDRLLARELVYSGVGRTPVCALVPSLPLRGKMCPVAAELFSTTADAYLLLGDVCEDSSATWTADGRPLTVEFSSERLARQVCADACSLGQDELVEMAACVRNAQRSQLAEACRQVAGGLTDRPRCFVTSGSGEFLARAVISTEFPGCSVRGLAEGYGPAVSHSAAAFAVAVLAEDATA